MNEDEKLLQNRNKMEDKEGKKKREGERASEPARERKEGTEKETPQKSHGWSPT